MLGNARSLLSHGYTIISMIANCSQAFCIGFEFKLYCYCSIVILYTLMKLKYSICEGIRNRDFAVYHVSMKDNNFGYSIDLEHWRRANQFDRSILIITIVNKLQSMLFFKFHTSVVSTDYLFSQTASATIFYYPALHCGLRWRFICCCHITLMCIYYLPMKYSAYYNIYF